jgi:hypothetical protein
MTFQADFDQFVASSHKAEALAPVAGDINGKLSLNS